MGSLKLLVEACKTCDDSFSDINKLGKRTSECSILHCRARGMPFDHAEEKAVLFFLEGQEGTHGAELICSHVKCRESIKFRYCASCNKGE